MYSCLHMYIQQGLMAVYGAMMEALTGERVVEFVLGLMMVFKLVEDKFSSLQMMLITFWTTSSGCVV